MATQAYPYMVLTDGTITVTIQPGDGSTGNYPLVRDGWAPAVAGLRASPLTGYTPYEDVVETFTIEINGTTATLALGRLATLTKLLDQAARWYRGENVAAVLLKIAPHGSTISSTAAPLQVAILGGSVKAPPRWDEVGRNFVIPNVEVSVIRRGLWLAAEESAGSGSVSNGAAAGFTFAAGAQSFDSPMKLTITNYGYGRTSGMRYHGGFILIGEPVGGSSPITISNAKDGASGAFTSTAPAGSTHPLATNVLRYTPVGTTEATSGVITPSLPQTTNLVAVFANIRPSATVSFTVRVRIDSFIYNAYTPYVTIAANATQYPKWYFIGVVAKSSSKSDVYLHVTASAASSSLDIDTIVLCDARAVQVLALPGLGDSDPNSVDTLNTLVIDPALLTYSQPTSLMGGTPVPYLGAAVLSTRAATAYGLALLTGGGTTANGDEYRLCDTTTDAVLSNTWTLARRPAYVVPQ